MYYKKLFSIFVYITLTLLMLFLFLLIIGIFFIRSPSGTTWLTSQLISLLNAHGVIVTVSSINGPFPEKITVNDLQLSDQKGTWFTMTSGEITINLWSLFKGQLDILSFTLVDPYLIRLPFDTPPSKTSPTNFVIPEISLNFYPWWLEHIKINDLDIHGMYVSSEVLDIPLTFNITGKRNQKNWDSHFTVLSPKLPDINGELHYCANNEQVSYIRSSRVITLQVDGKPHKTFPQGILDQPLYIHLSLFPEAHRIILHSLSAEYETWLLSAKKIELSNDIFQGSIQLSHHGEKTSKIPIGEMNALIDITGTLNKPQFNITLQLPNIAHTEQPFFLQSNVLIALELTNNLSKLSTDGILTLQGLTPLTHSYTSHITIDAIATPNTVVINSAKLVGPLASLSLLGKLETVTGNIMATIQGTIPTLAPFSSLAGLIQLSGAHSFNIDIERQNFDTPIKGISTISFTDMNWGMEIIQGLLGTDTNIKGTFKISPDKYPMISLGTINLISNNLHAESTLTIHKKQIHGSLNITIPDLSLTNLPINGELYSSMTAQGTLDTPIIQANISSPKLTIETIHIDDPKLLLTTTESTTNSINGTITLSSSPTSPSIVNLSTNWELLPKTIKLQKILGEILDSKLHGDIVIEQPTYTIDGTLIANIPSLEQIGQILSTSLTGSTNVTVQFTSKNNQTILTNWNLKNFSMNDTFFLNNMNGHFLVEQIHKVPKITFSSQIGTGKYDLFQWTQGKLDINGSLDNLHTHLNMLGKTTALIDLQTNLINKTALIKKLDIKETQKKLGLSLTHPTSISVLPQKFMIKNLSLTLLPSGGITTNMYISPEKLTIEATVKNTPLSLLHTITDLLPQGTVTGTINLTGTPKNPRGSISLDVTDINYPETTLPTSDIHIKGAITSTNHLNINATLSEKGKRIPATIKATFPLDTNEQSIPIISQNKPFSGECYWNGEIGTLWKFMPIADRELSGTGLIKGTFSGNINKPVYDLVATLTDANYQDLATGLYITNTNAKLTLSSHKTSHIQLTGFDGKQGKMEVYGTINSLIIDSPISIKGTFTNFAPLYRKDLNVVFSGITTLTGVVRHPKISGELTINQGEFQITETLSTDIPTLNIIEKPKGTSVTTKITTTTTTTNYIPSLAINLKIPNRFFVRSNNFESEWGGNLSITDTIITPRIVGELNSIRGYITLLGKQFLLNKSTISFTGSTPPNPLLNISLTYTSPSITASGTLSGTIAKPTITLSSTPSLPQDEIISQILFGKNAQTLSKIQTIQLAQELANLTGFNTTNTNILGDIRKTIGIDVLNLGSVTKKKTTLSPTEDQTEDIPVVELGKYITDTVYVGVEQSYLDTNDTGARVEIELAPNLNLEGRTSTQNEEIGINWKKDY